jgi:uroporphyrin-III C-methyltransferase
MADRVLTRPPGRLWLVGAGPGDPDLLTVAARRLLDTADIVVHDRLVGDAILATIPPGTPRINVGKTGYRGGPDQHEINRRLLELVLAGHDVVRLKGGDPFVFGRGAEELLELAAEGVDVRVVPGITAGIAGPGAFGIPVTHRGLASSVVFVTGHQEPGDATAPAWETLARIDTVVVYMGGRTASRVGRRLMDAGRDGSTPVAVIIAATTDQARIHVTDLARLATDGAPDAGPGPDPVLLVIGEVVRLQAATRGTAVVAPMSLVELLGRC